MDAAAHLGFSTEFEACVGSNIVSDIADMLS